MSSTLDVTDIGALLRNQGGRQVLLTIRSGGTEAARQVIVVPITNERSLRYGDWEYTRRLVVEERGAGDIGYVHLRAMGSNDLTAWYRQFYPVFNRQGLILDVRRNNGGNIDSIILEKLMRRAWMYWQQRVGRHRDRNRSGGLPDQLEHDGSRLPAGPPRHRRGRLHRH